MADKIINSNTCKPFLRWAGGKSWLTKYLPNLIPSKYNNYHEPFLGGGAVFFSLNPRKSYLSDLNHELIETYIEIRDNVEKVIYELSKFENTEECYYRVRDLILKSPVKKAARFIFLNQTSFNGIYRVNLKGQYNVPYGYRTKDFFDPENLRVTSKRLQNAKIVCSDFSTTIKSVKENDLVFLDPPYTVTHNNNGFIKYNKKLFDLESQHNLSKFIDQVKERNAFYILTNAAHDEIRKIFSKAGDTITEMDRASLIGGKNAARGKYAEFIITNLK